MYRKALLTVGVRRPLLDERPCCRGATPSWPRGQGRPRRVSSDGVTLLEL
jgi:hypothetical protein